MESVVAIGRGSRGRGRGFRRMPLEETSDVPEAFSRMCVVGTYIYQPHDAVTVPESVCPDSRKSADTGTDVHVHAAEIFDKKGTTGERCNCLSNFVKLRKIEAISVYEYHVAFLPVLESTKLKKAMIKQLEKVIGGVNTFDGQTLYLPKTLPKELNVVNCKHPINNEMEVTTTIKFVKEKKTNEELTQFYSSLFQRILLIHGYLEIRRGFYKISEVRELSREKLQVWPGVALSVEVKDDGLLVMFDSPSRVLRMETLYDFYKQFQEKEDNLDNLQAIFSAFVIGKIVLCQYSNQCYKIDDVAYNLSPKSYFTYKNREITYEQYFQMQYNVVIKDLNQPLVVSRIKPRNANHPSPPVEVARVIALVPELCHLTGLTSEQRSNYKLMTEIGAITRLNPRLRISAICYLIKEIAESSQAQDILANWGLKLEKDVVNFLGRNITSPALSFHQKGESKLVSSSFHKEACRSCYHPVPVKKFVVFCVRQDLECARNFVVEYSEACSTVGIPLRTKGEIIQVDNNREKIIPSIFVKALEEFCNNCEGVQFVVVILPFYREDMYRAVKRFCLTLHPVPSQCVMSKTLRNRSIKKVAINICLQINCKLGGSLWGLKLPLMNKVMIIGMDAAHDPSRKNPSVIALVATLNAECTVHFSRCSYQPIHQEICTSLRVIFKDALHAYAQYNAGELPDKIIFYRDGGSAATFDVLKKYEVDVCLDVLQEDTVAAKKTVNFSYLCVAKRIPQKILLRAEGNNIVNPPPGTVLDHSITTPSRYDFYIVSQQVYQGTVSPTHYSVLYETQRTKPDIMQKISYAMTFMYYNWQGTIKVPSVIQYSHKLGQLVSRIQAMPNRTMSQSLYFL